MPPSLPEVSILFGVYPEVELLDHMILLYPEVELLDHMILF